MLLYEIYIPRVIQNLEINVIIYQKESQQPMLNNHEL